MSEMEIDATPIQAMTNQSNIFPLLKLPNPIINQIVSYYLPFPGFLTISSDDLAKNMLPLALTCTQMFDLITSSIPQFIHQDHMFILMVNTFTIGSPSHNRLLYRAARISLNKMMHGSIPQSEIDLKPEQYETQVSDEDECNQKAPLFSIEGHTETCRVKLAWITLAAYSNKLSQLKFFFTGVGPHDHHQYCAVRLLSLLNVSLQKLHLNSSYDYTELSHQATHKFMKVSNLTLADLAVDITNVAWLDCLRRTHLPGLKKLSLNIYHTIREYPRDVIRGQLIETLSALNQHGTKLVKLAVPSLYFLLLEENDQPINLATLTPTVRHLHLTNYHPWTKGENNFENSLNHCGELETLEFKDYSLNMENINNSMKAGFLQNLKRIICTRLRSIIIQEHLKEDRLFPKLMGLIENLYVHNAMNGIFLDNFQSSFPSLRSLSLRIYPKNIVRLCEFVKQANHLTSLSIYLNKDDDNPESLDHEPICTDDLYYSSHIVDLVMQKSSSLEEIQLFGCYVTVDESIEVLRNMGTRAKVFRIPLSDEFHAFNDYMYLSHSEISANSIIRALDVVIENCPNIEKLNFTSIFKWRRWKSRDVSRVAFKVKCLMQKVATFEPSSFAWQFGISHDDRRYWYQYSPEESTS